MKVAHVHLEQVRKSNKILSKDVKNKKIVDANKKSIDMLNDEYLKISCV